MKKILYLLTIVFLASCAPDVKDNVIYGLDHRRDYHQVTNPVVLKNMRSTVAIVEASSVTKVAGGMVFKTRIFGQAYGLCPKEPYWYQPIFAYCSGFAVNDSTIVTAGHCGDAILNSYLIFGYQSSGTNLYSLSAPDSLVYRVKSIKKRIKTSTVDFLVLTVDKKIPTHRIAAVNTSFKPRTGTKVYCVGYPCGLPVKMTSGATIRANRGTYFTTNLDTYGGNSGSAVFNQSTNRIEGILVRGEDDFVRSGNCNVSKRCTDTGCRGEEVVWIDQVVKYF